MTKEQESEGFTVKDKRAFREDGGLREDAPREETPKKSASEPFEVLNDGKASQEAPPGTGARIDFPSYILSYYTQGLVLLGEVPNPVDQQKKTDLAMASHNIDTIMLLQEKTKGNLTPAEDRLCMEILNELRLKYANTLQVKK